MPTLHLTGLTPDLVSRVRAYARARDLSTAAGAAHLLSVGLQSVAARTAGATALNASRTPEERSAAARKAVLARYGRTAPV